MDELLLLDGSYQDAVSALLSKYGYAADDYFSEKSYNRFLAGEIKAPAKRKIARTGEGLYCHHIDEDKQCLVASPKAIRFFSIPFAYQRKDRLVYCNLIEHAILHILIATETSSVVDCPLGQRLGIGGYMFFLRPQIIQWFVNGVAPTLQWQINCYDTARVDTGKAKQLVKEMDAFLLAHYPDVTQSRLDAAYENYVNGIPAGRAALLI